jgi:acetate kinase
MPSALLVVNAGSSSVKFGVFDRDAGDSIVPIARGGIDAHGSERRFVARDPKGQLIDDRRWSGSGETGVREMLAAILEWVARSVGADRLAAAGHRIVLGGLQHTAPSRIDAELLDGLRALIPISPLHLPRNLEAIEAVTELRPDLAQVACFDTAFHATVPRVAQLYGLPRALTEAGARRYGFHGLSYESIAASLETISPEAAAGRTVVAHLGSGASMCALVGGRSVATTMGFTPLSGIMMGTRAGELDPGLVLWMLEERGMSLADVRRTLYHESGLLGVSGLSNDMRTLLASDNPNAKEAVDLFVYRILRELGSLQAAAGGLDAIVFTGGIGEHAAEIRSRVCREARWLGIELDAAANERHGPRITPASSPVAAWVVPTDEESVIARHTARVVR